MNQQTHEYIEKLESALRSMGILEFSGDMQLLEWSKSTSRDGPKVKFMLPDDESVIPFEVATVKKGKTAGQLYHIFAIRIDDNDTRTNSYVLDQPEPKLDEKTPNYLAQSMHRNGYFRNPKLWAAMEEKGIYTQEMHKEYVQSLQCCGIKFARHIECHGDVVMHHVKTSANSGVGIKPQHWYGVPLCATGHHMTWAHGSHKGSASHEDRHDVMLPHAVGLTAERVKAAFKDSLGLESLSEITQEMLNDFEKYLFGQVVNNYAA